MRKVYIAGIGMGNESGLTIEVRDAINQADIVAGAARMLEVAGGEGKRIFNSYKPEEIAEFLDREEDWEKACILMSGDVGFYSGAKRLIKLLDVYDVTLLPGISTLAMLCSRLKISWDEVAFASMHGRKCNICNMVTHNRYTFVLLGGGSDVKIICDKLIDYEIDARIYVGQRLGYDDERIIWGSADEMRDTEFEKLSAVILINENPRAQGEIIGDDEFIRSRDGKVIPMTKEEVRTLSISKLQPGKSSIVYDIGAGTGSVAIQMALNQPDSQVYAIEKNDKAVELIGRNRRRFGADNVEIINGDAPQALYGLPAPTHVFIGGSGGNMEAIIDAVYEKNPQTVIVLNVISLDTLGEVMRIIKKYNLDARITQVNISRSRSCMGHHLMEGLNPVTIIKISNLSGKRRKD